MTTVDLNSCDIFILTSFSTVFSFSCTTKPRCNTPWLPCFPTREIKRINVFFRTGSLDNLLVWGNQKQSMKTQFYNLFVSCMCRSLVRSNDLILNNVSENRNSQVVVRVMIILKYFYSAEQNHTKQTQLGSRTLKAFRQDQTNLNYRWQWVFLKSLYKILSLTL